MLGVRLVTGNVTADHIKLSHIHKLIEDYYIHYSFLEHVQILYT